MADLLLDLDSLTKSAYAFGPNPHYFTISEAFLDNICLRLEEEELSCLDRTIFDLVS